MKTSTTEVRCDGCGRTIPVMHPSAIFVTLRGPAIGHRKLDLHDAACLSTWAMQYADDVRAERALQKVRAGAAYTQEPSNEP